MVERVSPSPQATTDDAAVSGVQTAPARRAEERLPRRRPVKRHPGIYYRPRRDGKVGPPYEISYLDSNGRRRWEIIHANLDAAEARRAELRLRRRRGERIEPCRQTFQQHADEWLERQGARERTLELYRWALTNHLITYFGRRRLNEITSDDIAAYIAHMQHKGLKGWTITSSLRPLSIILSQAARKGRIPNNPMSQLERGERPRHDDERPKRILSLEEMQALIAATETLQTRCLFELLLASGLRIGEALGLTAADLDPDNSIIRVQYQLDRNGSRTPLKTEESQRAIDIPPKLTRKLRALLLQRGALTIPHAFIFASRNETGLERKVVRNALSRSITKARIAAPAPTLHDLRHSHASMLIALDYSVVDVQHRLGHRKPDTTLRIYTHQWHYRNAQESRIGDHIGHLFSEAQRNQLAASKQLALPAASNIHTG
jgi:site-specific recombinase XerD